MEVAGTRTGLSAVSRRMARSTVAILAYHNVVPPDEAGHGDSSLHLPLAAFIAQVERLTRTHRVVDLRTLASEDRPSEESNDHRPRAVITFDDAYRGAITHAIPELVRRRLPATVFVAPGLLGARGTWWDEGGEAGTLNDQTREEALSAKGTPDCAHRLLADASSPPELPSSYGIATLDELMDASGGAISVGSHTWLHEHLPSLDDDELDRTLGSSLEWVRELGEAACSWLALPYGAGSVCQGRRALELGYEGVLRIRGGLWRPSPDRAFVPRINVPAGISPAGLELRTSGILRNR